MKAKFNGILTLLLALTVQFVFAQKTVSGTVTDETGPLPGVNIIIKGTATGTETDFDGNYSIQVKQGDILVFSYVGMESQEVTVGASNTMNVVLKSSNVLDEVVVVAYGTQKKSSITGSVGDVSSDKLLTNRSDSVDKMLTGKVAGVRVTSTTGDPGSAGDIQVRGIGSITGTTKPLYVIDGVPAVTGNYGFGISGDVLSSLNPEDIESMTILKDAAAASLYGSRAANGVVIITTKKGKTGETKFNFKTSYGITDLATNSYEVMSGEEFTDYFKAALEGYYLNSSSALYPNQANYGNATINANAKAFAEANYLNPDWSYLTERRNGEDWRGLIYSGGHNADYAFSANGGTEKTKYFASLGYKDVDGVALGTSFKRYSTLLSINNKAKDWLEFEFKNQLSYTDQLGRNDQSDQAQGIATASPLSMLLSSNPTEFAYNEDGSLNMYSNFNDKVKNPIYALSPKQASITNKTYRIINNLGAKVNFTKDLFFKTTNGVDYFSVNGFNYWAPTSIDGESLNGLGEKSNEKVLSFTTSNILNYSKIFNDVHNLQALVGVEAQKYEENWDYLSANNYSNDELIELGNAQPRDASSGFVNNFMLSYLSNLNYNYDNRYYLGASLRQDESSKLGANNRVGTFYSVSAAWRFGREAFIKNDFLTDGKLRFSYGTNGNLPPGSYSSLGLYSFSGSYNDNPASYLSQIPNEDLQWEKSENMNAGIELTFLNRINLTVEYFDKYTTDLLLAVPVSYLSGTASQMRNVGEISNKGFEFSLQGNDILKSKLKWDSNFTLGTLKAMVEKLPDGDIIDGDGGLYIYREGEELYSYYLPTYAGVDPDSGVARFLIDPTQPAGDGNYTYNYVQAGKTLQGSAYPNITGGFNNSFTFGNFNISALLTYQFGGKLFDYGGYFLHHDGIRAWSFNLAKDVAGNYWTKPGDIVDNPRPTLSNSNRPDRWSTRHLFSTDFIRLKEISLGYTVPKSAYEKIGIDRIDISVIGNNLTFLYAATKDMELEVPLNGYRTVDTPLARTIALGFNIGF